MNPDKDLREAGERARASGLPRGLRRRLQDEAAMALTEARAVRGIGRAGRGRPVLAYVATAALLLGVFFLAWERMGSSSEPTVAGATEERQLRLREALELEQHIGLARRRCEDDLAAFRKRHLSYDRPSSLGARTQSLRASVRETRLKLDLELALFGRAVDPLDGDGS